MLQLVGQGKPNKVSVPQGTTLSSLPHYTPSSHLRTEFNAARCCHSSATKDVTSPIPVVGSVVEGVGNAPIAQKIGGKEEEKGYLGSVYDYAGSALRTVYDAAGNVVCILLFLYSSSSCLSPPLLPPSITSQLT